MSELKPNAETFRVRALAHLVAKDLAQAQLEIRKALELEPRWKSIRFAAATIDYFSTLSPAALPDRLVPWPEPVDWVQVKRDEESTGRLREAAELFRELAEDPAKKDEERLMLESWCLACLANDAERQDQAIEYCRSILKADPTHSCAIAWARARNFDIDLKPSEETLEKLIADGTATILHILALVDCYLATRRVGDAVKLLEHTKPIFQKHQADVLWTSLHVQLLVFSGDPETAITAIDSSKSKPELLHVRTMPLRALANETGDWHALIQHLESSYADTGDPSFLFELCELMAQLQDWAYVADRAERLVDEFGTGEALRLAAIAAHNAERFDLCLRLLDEHRGLFEQRKLPIELRRIRVSCQRNLGVLAEAIIEAEALAREEPTTEHLLNLAQLYFEKGDLKGLALVARQLNSRPDLAAEPSLRTARLVQWEDRGLAISLWRKALSEGPPDSFVAEAVALGFQLGLDKELRPLMARMAELERQGRGGIQTATIDELIAFAAQQREHTAQLVEAYRNGTVPIHVIAEELNWPLVDLYHRFLEEFEARPDPTRQFALLVRHGGRALMSGFPKSIPKWRLNLDLTAVLLGAHLGILTEVEGAFKPLRIPADVVPALVRMRDKVTHHQPSRLQACRQIVDLADRKSLEVVKCDLPPNYANLQLVDELGEGWVALFENVRATGGYLVDFLPLKKRDRSGPPSTLPEDAGQYLVNCRGVVEALREQGPLSDKEYHDAIEELGYEGRMIASETIPPEGSALYCHASIPEVLASANLLSTVCDRFQVCIEERKFDRVRKELREHEQRQALAEWLDELIDRISKGMDNGTYEVVPTLPDEGGTSEEAATENPDFGCLVTLLRFEAREDDVIWADDRYINSYLRRDAVPIIGINEVLKALVSIGALKVTDYYHKLGKLRTANVRIIPVQEDDILHHLLQARIKDGRVIETRGLIGLRRYIAACLLHGDILQRPPMPEGAPNENGEVPFVLTLGRAIINALVELWATEDNDEAARQARADWLVANLYLDHLGMFKVTSLPRSVGDDRYLVAISLAGLVSQAIRLPPGRKGDESSPRRRYFDWLSNRVLRRRFDADPQLVLGVADILKKTLLSTQEEMREEGPPSIVIGLLQAFYADLPEQIRKELWSDTDFMASIGIRPLIAITIDDLKFHPNDFFRAAAEAINRREATIAPIDLDKEVTFKPFDDRRARGVFCFKHPVTGERRVIENEELELLLESPTEREAVLRRNRHWFDCQDETLDRVVATIVSIEDPRRRVEEARSWRESSAAVYYADLHGRLSKRPQLQLTDLLPPSAEGLLRHFRLAPSVGPDEALQEALASAALRLIHEEGLLTALVRLAGLPVPLPAPLVEAIAELSPRDRHMLIKRLLRTAGSPVSKVHLVYLLLHLGGETAAFWRLARWVITGLLGTAGEQEFEAFLAILKWVNQEFTHWRNIRVWPSHIQLGMVWAHAHQLLTIFLSAGAPTLWLRDTFNQMGQRIPLEPFERVPDYWFDVSHPRQVSRVPFLLGGLSYSLGEEAMGFLEKGFRDLLTALSFHEMDGKWVPALPLLRDVTQAPNSLGSFLGGDRGERLSSLLGTEAAAESTLYSPRALAEQAVDTLSEASDVFSAWLLLHATLGGLPPQEDLADRLKAIIRETDYVGLFRKDPDLGCIAMETSSLQVINVGDEHLRSHLKDQLVKITKLSAALEYGDVDFNTASADNFGELTARCLVLIESASNISIAVQPPKDVIAEFASLLTQLVRAWQSMIPVCRPIVQRLYEELPIAQAQQFSTLLVRLRAE